MKFFVVICIVILLLKEAIFAGSSEQHPDVEQGSIRSSQHSGADTSELSANRGLSVSKDHAGFHIYCHNATASHILAMWSSIEVHIQTECNYFVLHVGDNSSVVRDMKSHKDESWLYQMLGIQASYNSVRLSPYKYQCVGVDIASEYSYEIAIYRKYIDIRYPVFFVAGLILFLKAATLSRNVFFYYTSGVAMSWLASLLIVMFILSRFMPKKFGATALLLGGWAWTAYILQFIWQHITDILKDYPELVAGYFIVVGFFSFAILYWYGPTSNERTLNLVKWTIQMCGMLLMYNGSQLPRVSVAMILVVLAYHNFPILWITAVKSEWRRKFPPKIRLLTNEEFMIQGSDETRRALDELRTYCQSPGCKTWNLVNKLGTPVRFASFVEGGSHLSDGEITTYEDTLDHSQLMSDDSSEGSDMDVDS